LQKTFFKFQATRMLKFKKKLMVITQRDLCCI